DRNSRADHGSARERYGAFGFDEHLLGLGGAEGEHGAVKYVFSLLIEMHPEVQLKRPASFETRRNGDRKVHVVQHTNRQRRGTFLWPAYPISLLTSFGDHVVK